MVKNLIAIIYHRDNLIMGLGIAKGYLMADESDNVRGRALQEQDLAFQRKLPFVQKAYLLGIKKMLLLISYYLGANLDTLNIDIKIKLPHRLSAEMLEQYRSSIEYIAEVKNLMLDINPSHQLTLEDLNLLIYKAGLDPEIVNIPGLISVPREDLGGDANQGSDFETAGGGFDVDADEFGVEDNAVDFGESLRRVPTKARHKLAEKIGIALTEHLKQSWYSKVELNYATVLMEDTKTPRYNVAVDGVAIPSKLYECFLRVGWLGSKSKLHEPDEFFRRLHKTQQLMYLIEPSE